MLNTAIKDVLPNTMSELLTLGCKDLIACINDDSYAVHNAFWLEPQDAHLSKDCIQRTHVGFVGAITSQTLGFGHGDYPNDNICLGPVYFEERNSSIYHKLMAIAYFISGHAWFAYNELNRAGVGCTSTVNCNFVQLLWSDNLQPYCCFTNKKEATVFVDKCDYVIESLINSAL